MGFIIFLAGILILVKDKTLLYRECPNCHQSKKVKFSIIGLGLLICSAVGSIFALIYLIIKINAFRCDKCHCLTQRIYAVHSNKSKQ